MPDTRLTVEIDGTPLDAEQVKLLAEVQVEEATDLADAATLTAGVEPSTAGEWRSLLDPLVAPRTPLVVQLERGGASYRFEGGSTEVGWQLEVTGASSITVKALDRTLDLDAEEKVAAWSGMSDSAIAQAIYAAHGLTAEVEDTPQGPDPDVHVALQRATDWAFVRALAVKWGYAAYLEAGPAGVVGHFHSLDPLGEPQAELSLGYGGAADSVAVQAQLTGGQRVLASRIPPLSDAPRDGDARGDDQAQGATPLGGQTTVLLVPTDVDGEIDPSAATTGLARHSAFALTLTATVDVDRTGLLLRARRTVLVKGLGSALSGRYLVQRVRHTVTPSGHRQEVTLVRNALGLVGDEPFGSAGGLGALAGALGGL